MNAKNRTKEYVAIIKKNIEAIEEMIYLIRDDGEMDSPESEIDMAELAREIKRAKATIELLERRLKSYS